jgi:two-component system chemotaxis response regulator CheB
MLELKNQGSLTLAQSEETCAVYGMPRAAVEIGAACGVDSPEGMAATINECLVHRRAAS